jgi:hypothetical protein
MSICSRRSSACPKSSIYNRGVRPGASVDSPTDRVEVKARPGEPNRPRLPGWRRRRCKNRRHRWWCQSSPTRSTACRRLQPSAAPALRCQARARTGLSKSDGRGRCRQSCGDGCSGILAPVIVGKAANQRADVMRVDGLQHPLEGLSCAHVPYSHSVGYRDCGGSTTAAIEVSTRR